MAIEPGRVQSLHGQGQLPALVQNGNKNSAPNPNPNQKMPFVIVISCNVMGRLWDSAFKSCSVVSPRAFSSALWLRVLLEHSDAKFRKLRHTDAALV